MGVCFDYKTSVPRSPAILLDYCHHDFDQIVNKLYITVQNDTKLSGNVHNNVQLSKHIQKTNEETRV